MYKTEYDPDETVTITIKQKGKRKGRSYDLCPEAAEALEQALVSKKPHTVVVRGKKITEEVVRTAEMMYSDDDLPDDDAFISEKMAQRAAENGDDTPPKSDMEVEAASERVAVGGGMTEDGAQCMHPNKTPPRNRTVKGKKGFWHVCKDCGALIKPISAKSREEYHRAKPPNGVNIKTHGAEDRRRD